MDFAAIERLAHIGASKKFLNFLKPKYPPKNTVFTSLAVNDLVYITKGFWRGKSGRLTNIYRSGSFTNPNFFYSISTYEFSPLTHQKVSPEGHLLGTDKFRKTPAKFSADMFIKVKQ